MSLLAGKKILITGVLTQHSIAFHVARLAQEQGATVILTSFGRQMKLTQAIAKRLPEPAPVLTLDVTNREDLDTLKDRVLEHVDGLDGVVHSIGFAPQSVMGGNFLSGEWADVATALEISAFSLKSLAVATQPLMSTGGSVVGLTFDAKFAWPVYDWMGWRKQPSNRPLGILRVTLVRRGFGLTSYQQDRSAPLLQSPFRALNRWKGTGPTERRLGGTSRTRNQPHARWQHCCQTGSRQQLARSFM